MSNPQRYGPSPLAPYIQAMAAEAQRKLAAKMMAMCDNPEVKTVMAAIDKDISRALELRARDISNQMIDCRGKPLTRADFDAAAKAIITAYEKPQVGVLGDTIDAQFEADRDESYRIHTMELKDGILKVDYSTVVSGEVDVATATGNITGLERIPTQEELDKIVEEVMAGDDAAQSLCINGRQVVVP